jgi:hypothetical protein
VQAIVGCAQASAAGSGEQFVELSPLRARMDFVYGDGVARRERCQWESVRRSRLLPGREACSGCPQSIIGGAGDRRQRTPSRARSRTLDRSRSPRTNVGRCRSSAVGSQLPPRALLQRPPPCRRPLPLRGVTSLASVVQTVAFASARSAASSDSPRRGSCATATRKARAASGTIRRCRRIRLELEPFL